MPDNQVDEIKNRLDVVEVIRGYMKLEKSGVNLRGLCPFHREKTPSFFVSPSRQLWRCFGCSVGGDMFSFVQEIDGVDFKEALKLLADKAGVQLRSYDPQVRSEKARIYEVCEKSCQFFEKQLTASQLGRESSDYLLGRGISGESIEKFRIGFAPHTRNALSAFLRAQGYSPAEIFKAGVSIQAENGLYDRFRSRIIFPIADLNGQVIGFGGRVFFAKNQTPDPKLAKYINTPQTPLYDKSRVLYGLDKAKMKIRESDTCMLVEGYTDVIMAHQTGAENVAAVSGTALTEHQLDIVRRYTGNLHILFDMDIAGDNATKRGIDIAQRKGFEISIITLPEGKDPAELIQRNTKGWQKALAKPLSIGEFYFESALSRFDKLTPEGMQNISDVVLPMIKQIPSEIQRSFWVQKLAGELACGEDVVWRDLAKVPEQAQPPPDTKEMPKAQSPTSASSKRTKRNILYEHILLLISQNPDSAKDLRKKDIALFDANIPAASTILKLRKKTPLTPEESEVLESVAFQEEIFPTRDTNISAEDEFQLCLNSLRTVTLRETLLAMQQKMKHGKKDMPTVEEFQRVSMELAKIEYP